MRLVSLSSYHSRSPFRRRSSLLSVQFPTPQSTFPRAHIYRRTEGEIESTCVRARDLPSFLVRSRTLFLSSFSLSLSFSHARTHTLSLRVCARASGVTLRKRKREKRRRHKKLRTRRYFFRSFSFFFLASGVWESRCSLHAIIYTKILLWKNERTQEKHTNDDAFPTTTSSRGVLLRALVVLEKQRSVRAVFVFFFFDVHAFFWFRGERKRKRRDGNETTLFRVLR